MSASVGDNTMEQDARTLGVSLLESMSLAGWPDADIERELNLMLKTKPRGVRGVWVIRPKTGKGS